MPTVEQATKTLNDLMDARDQLIGRSAKLVSDRQAIAYAAHTGDKGAKERLRKINDESVLHNAELESVDAAIAEANARLAATKQAETQQADRANAEQLRGNLTKFKEIGDQLDDAVWDIATSVNEMVALLNAMHQLGAASPTNEQFRVNGTMALKTMLQELPQLWVNDFDFARLAPNQKKTFKDIISGWQAMIEQNVTARLGNEQKQTEAA